MNDLAYLCGWFCKWRTDYDRLCFLSLHVWFYKELGRRMILFPIAACLILHRIRQLYQ